MKKRLKIPIIITIIALVLSCFTLPAFATPTNASPDGTNYEPVFYPRYIQYQMFNVDDMSQAFYATYDTSYVNDAFTEGNNSTTSLGFDLNGNHVTCLSGSSPSIFYNTVVSQYSYIDYYSAQVVQDEYAPLNITYYFDDVGVRSDLYDNINYQDLYSFATSFEDQDRNNLLEGFTVYFTYKSYDYAADDFRITNYQQRFTRVSNTLTSFVSSAIGVDSSMLYVNPLELVKAEAEANGLSLFGILTDIRVEVDLSFSVNPQIISLSLADDVGFNEVHTTTVRDDLYTQYGEDNAASAEVPTDVFGWVVDCASSLFEFELMPGLSISIIFVGILGILVFIYIMKRFAGG